MSSLASRKILRNGLLLALGTASVVGAGCAPDFEKLSRRASPRGTLGTDIYQVLCRRVAGTELPTDVDGRESETLCLGDEATARAELTRRASALPPRLLALAERRERIVDAFDAVFPGEIASELEDVMQGLVPFYEPPRAYIPESTRSLASLLVELAKDPGALRDLARLSRAGMVPVGTGMGALRLSASHRDLSDTARKVLPIILGEGAAAPAFAAFRAALAYSLATADALDADEIADRDDLERLAYLPEAGDEGSFGTGESLFTALRDPRGLPVPDGDVYPFTSVDGLPELAGDSLAADAGFGARVPEPFAVVGEGTVARDEQGRACALTPDGPDCTRTLYSYSADRDPTLISALLQELPKLFGTTGSSFGESLIAALPALLEDATPATASYGSATLSYPARDTQHSSLLELVHAAGALVPTESYDQGLALTTRLLREAEEPLTEAITPWIDVERITRADGDAYPEAVLPNDHTFWDELLFEVEKFSRRRRSAEGENALQAMARGALGFARDPANLAAPLSRRVPLAQLSHQGALLSALMRFKDEWRLNPRGESERAPNEPGLIGAFRAPVDRALPDVAVTCGKDGCGGPIEGSPFESFRLEGQNCMAQRPGRPASGRDCGAPSNQSIFQRSLGLLWEMAGRSQCNKVISIGDLLEFVADDVCTELADPASESGDPRLCKNNAGCADFVVDGVTNGFTCDTARGQCIATKGSPACVALKRQETQRRDQLAQQAETALAQDYVCPADRPAAACHAYEQRFPSAFIDPDGEGPAESAVQACHLLDLPDVGRTFGKVLTREFVIDVPNPWVRRYLEDVARAGPMPGNPDVYAIASCKDVLPNFHIEDPTQTPPCIPEAARLTRDFYNTVPGEVDSLGEFVEFMLDDSSLFAGDADTLALRPDPKALSRVLFAPQGESSLTLFEPLLTHGAPAACVAGGKLPACSADDTVVTDAKACCITDPLTPPLRYRVDTYYGATSFAWEQEIAFADGTKLSFLDTMGPLADAFNRLDYVAGTDDPANFEDLSYGLTSLGKLVSEHYDSAENPSAQTANPDAAWYRRGTGLVHYERLVADLLDDGTAVREQAGPDGERLFDTDAPEDSAFGLWRGTVRLLNAMDRLAFSDQRDAIDVSVDVAESLLNPHAYCAGEAGDGRVLNGVGACAAGEPVRKPLARRDGSVALCWNDGRCFDGSRSTLPERFVSPLTLLLDAAHVIDVRGRDDQLVKQGLRGMFSGVFDAFAGVEDGQFSDRRARALALTMLDYARTRWQEHADDGSLASYAADMENDVRDMLEEPVVATALETLRIVGHDEAAARSLDALLASLTAPGLQRVLLATLSDALATSHLDDAWLASSHVLARALAPNVHEVMAGQGDLALDGSFVDLNLTLLRETAQLDPKAVSGRLLQNLVASQRGLDGFAPLDVLMEAVLAINRADPAANAAPDTRDYEAAFTRMAEVLTDERRGFERLYRIVQCTVSDGVSRACD